MLTRQGTEMKFIGSKTDKFEVVITFALALVMTSPLVLAAIAVV
tara:strand:- start:1116 stop:1247 length:132 start_codon:yes stop_codon:yes gene_type:complete